MPYYNSSDSDHEIETSSSSEIDESVECIQKVIETAFNNAEFGVIITNQPAEIARLTKYLADLYSIEPKLDHDLSQQMANICKQLCENQSSFAQAFIILTLKEVIYTGIKEQINPISGQHKLELIKQINDKIFSKDFLPQVELFHHSLQTLGTVVVKINCEEVAYFKPGDLNYQNLDFLAKLFSKLKEMMYLPENFESVFIPVVKANIFLQEIKSTQGILSEGLMHIEVRGEEGFKCKNISLKENKNRAAILSGCLQPALPNIKLEERLKCEKIILDILLMVSIILILGGRDIKGEEIKGHRSGILVDCKDFLEEKENLPALHLPFVEYIAKLRITVENLEQFKNHIDQLNSKEIEKFVRQQKFLETETFEIETFKEEKVWLDCGDSLCQLDEDKREEYKDKNPQYIDHCILSQSQIGYLIKNMERMQNLAKTLVSTKKDISFLTFICLYDEDWKKDLIKFTVLFDYLDRREGSRYANLFKNKEDESRQFLLKARGSSSPFELAGLSRSPTLSHSVSPKDEEKLLLSSVFGSSTANTSHVTMFSPQPQGAKNTASTLESMACKDEQQLLTH